MIEPNGSPTRAELSRVFKDPKVLHAIEDVLRRSGEMFPDEINGLTVDVATLTGRIDANEDAIDGLKTAEYLVAAISDVLTNERVLSGGNTGVSVDYSAAGLAKILVDVIAALGYTPTSVVGLTGVQTVAAFKTGLSLVKADVGLGNVDNTSDANKPVSTAQAAALALKLNLTGGTLTGPLLGTSIALSGAITALGLNGFGTASPTAPGHFANNSGSVGQIRIQQLGGSGKTWELQSYTDGALYFNNQALVPAFRLKDNLDADFYGNVTIDASKAFAALGTGLFGNDVALKKDNIVLGFFNTAGTRKGYIQLDNATGDFYLGHDTSSMGWAISSGATLIPFNNNAQDLGRPANRIKTGYMGSLDVTGAGSFGSVAATGLGAFGSLTATGSGTFGSVSSTGNGSFATLTVSGAASSGSLAVTGSGSFGNDVNLKKDNIVLSFTNTSGTRKGYLQVDNASGDFYIGHDTSGLGWAISTGAPLIPFNDNVQNAGRPANRIATIYLGSSPVVTSDAREKKWRGGLTDQEVEFGRVVQDEIGMYQWLTSLAEKGDGARFHCGVRAQVVFDLAKSHGLDPFAYAWACHDTWKADKKAKTKKGERFGIRPDQLLFWLVAVNHARLKSLELGAVTVRLAGR